MRVVEVGYGKLPEAPSPWSRHQERAVIETTELWPKASDLATLEALESELQGRRDDHRCAANRSPCSTSLIATEPYPAHHELTNHGKKRTMPLVRIDLPEGTSLEHRQGIVEVIYDALVNVAGAPVNDKFMIISEHKPADLVIDPTYMVGRTERALIIQITFNAGRTVEVKKKLYRAIANGLHERIGQRTEDVFIGVVEVPKENWSFGLGEAQYAD